MKNSKGYPKTGGGIPRRLRRSRAARVAVSAAAALKGDARFRTVACCFATAPADEWTRAAMEAFDESAPLPDDAAGATAALVRARLDALVFADLPLDGRALFFALSARVARVQVALAWAHFAPSPSLPSVDYYVAPAALAGTATTAAADRFGEQLVLLEGAGHALLPDPPHEPAAPTGAAERARARRARSRGGEGPARLYALPVAARSLAHPQFDAALVAILGGDGNASILVAAARSPADEYGADEFAGGGHSAPEALCAFLQSRICAAGGWTLAAPACGRLRFLAPLPIRDLRALVGAADAVLDASPVGSLDGLLLAAQERTPVVAFRRGARRGARYAAALLGGGAVLVDDAGAFAAAALRLADDPAFRESTVAAMDAAAAALFAPDAPPDLAAFLYAAAGARAAAGADAAAPPAPRGPWTLLRVVAGVALLAASRGLLAASRGALRVPARRRRRRKRRGGDIPAAA